MRTRTSLLFVLSALLAMPVAAQPSGSELIASWRQGWRTASADVGQVRFQEDAYRSMEGPRGAQALETRFDVRIGLEQRTERDFRRARLNGRPISQVRYNTLDRRLQRAYNPGYGWLRQPIMLTERMMHQLEPIGQPAPDRLGSQPVWRLETYPQNRSRIERVTLWFARTAQRERTRLLRARIIGAMPPRGSAAITTDYVSVDGLDLPGRTQVDVVLPQRRRQRVFTILMTADLRFTDYATALR